MTERKMISERAIYGNKSMSVLQKEYDVTESMRRTL